MTSTTFSGYFIHFFVFFCPLSTLQHAEYIFGQMCMHIVFFPFSWHLYINYNHIYMSYTHISHHIHIYNSVEYIYIWMWFWLEGPLSRMRNVQKRTKIKQVTTRYICIYHLTHQQKSRDSARGSDSRVNWFAANMNNKSLQDLSFFKESVSVFSGLIQWLDLQQVEMNLFHHQSLSPYTSAHPQTSTHKK